MICLFDGSTEIGRLSRFYNAGSTDMQVPNYTCRYITPSAGSHTYSVRGYYASGSSPNVQAGDGTGDNNPPAYIRVSHGG